MNPGVGLALKVGYKDIAEGQPNHAQQSAHGTRSETRIQVGIHLNRITDVVPPLLDSIIDQLLKFRYEEASEQRPENLGLDVSMLTKEPMLDGTG